MAAPMRHVTHTGLQLKYQCLSTHKSQFILFIRHDICMHPAKNVKTTSAKSHVSMQLQHHKIWHIFYLSGAVSQPVQMLATNLNNVHLVSGHKIQTQTIEHNDQC